MKQKICIEATIVDNEMQEYEVTVNGHCVTTVISDKADEELCRVFGFATAEHEMILSDRAVDMGMQRRKDGEHAR
jgi:hypothetical protein